MTFFTVNYCIIFQRLFCCQTTTSTNNTTIGNGNFITDITLWFKHIAIANFRCFHGAIYFKNIMRTNTQNGRCFWFRLAQRQSILERYQLILDNINSFTVYRWMIFVCSSIKHDSPIMIGPASATMDTFGWIIVPAPIVISPLRFESTHTSAPDIILILKFH